ncbi:MAG: hypothetical protein COV48_07855 [Elusimicrobia bacterium CG11_big_fil_rev_8_21_14_0_20_64_6]|nr:MAG: hypothetical protein COV48_07855 [Elusimicrobia bacterium CG11_big_fil_rev_8_21_14_0_20_64_6]
MKLLLLAGLLVLPSARAQQSDAYGSLVGMAVSAASDPGPQVGTVSPATTVAVERGYETISPDTQARTEFVAGRSAWPAKSARTSRSERETERDDSPAVVMPRAAVPRVWTRVFSALLPPMVRISSYEVAVSTVARIVRFETPRPETNAAVVGGARGVLELVAVATAPTLAER